VVVVVVAAAVRQRVVEAVAWDHPEDFALWRAAQEASGTLAHAAGLESPPSVGFRFLSSCSFLVAPIRSTFPPEKKKRKKLAASRTAQANAHSHIGTFSVSISVRQARKNKKRTRQKRKNKKNNTKQK
jgi:hypothetical protein